jgi:hypothetical protein
MVYSVVHSEHPRSQALFLSLLEGEKDPGWGWSRGSQNLGGKKIFISGKGHKGKNMRVSCVKLNKTETLMDPYLNHILCSEPRDQPQPGSFFSLEKGKEKSLGTRMHSENEYFFRTKIQSNS